MSKNTEDPSVTISKTNVKTAQAQAVLEAAKNRMATTQVNLKATQELYLQSSQQLLDQQTKLAEIRGEVTRLSQTQLGLEEIKKVPIECIKLIVQLKQQIMNLCRFFAALNSSIEAVAKYTAASFIEQIKGGDGGKRVGNYTLTDLTRTLIYRNVITIRAYFGVFGDIATMWMRLSNDNVMTGLSIGDDMVLNRGNMNALQAKAAKLQQWSTGAQETVRYIAERVSILPLS
ncbi:hypothetical protein MFIFM68171_03031 [Madurella fahalii]|uniref:Uncharacterized protein n=1 Tax=Madurella fahalii TaxID=1157608 RepID=A0ABQ0G4Z4_9PEZI